MKAKEDKCAEELKNQELVFAKVRHDFNSTTDGLRKQVGTYEDEVQAKSHSMRRLEDECSKLRVSAGQFESQLAARGSELASLESAMASLHGELSVLQRELDAAESISKQLGEEVLVARETARVATEEGVALRRERGESEQARGEIELQLSEVGGWVVGA
jgi:chromosome segregation ATPase